MSTVIEKQHAASILLNEDNRNDSPSESPVTVKSYEAHQAAYLADLNAAEDALLRDGNGIVDAVVFPRLRAMDVAEADLHREAMGLVRQVQYGLDHDGAITTLLGVVRCGINGTTAAPEVR